MHVWKGLKPVLLSAALCLGCCCDGKQLPAGIAHLPSRRRSPQLAQSRFCLFSAARWCPARVTSPSCPKPPTRRAGTSPGTTRMTWTPPSTPARRLNSCAPGRLRPSSAALTRSPMTAPRRSPPRRSRAKPAAPGPPGMCLPCLGWWYWGLMRRKTTSVRLRQDVCFSLKRMRKHLAAKLHRAGLLSSRGAGGCCANLVAEAVWWPLGPRWHAERLPDAGSSAAFNLTVPSCTKSRHSPARCLGLVFFFGFVFPLRLDSRKETARHWLLVSQSYPSLAPPQTKKGTSSSRLRHSPTAWD